MKPKYKTHYKPGICCTKMWHLARYSSSCAVFVYLLGHPHHLCTLIIHIYTAAIKTQKCFNLTKNKLKCNLTGIKGSIRNASQHFDID